MAVYGTEKFNGDIINLLGKEFKVAAAEKTAVSKDSYMSSMYSGVYYVVVDSKATLAEIFNLNSSLGEDSVPTMLNNEIDYNLYGSSEDKLAVAKALDKHFEENSVKSDVSGFYEESVMQTENRFMYCMVACSLSEYSLERCFLWLL